MSYIFVYYRKYYLQDIENETHRVHLLHLSNKKIR